MPAPVLGWTEPQPLAALHADPSGVQEASTEFQADLLSGMSTVTDRLRYLSLFATARYYRALTVDETARAVPFAQSLRRLEALIAVSSIRHHTTTTPPSGIIGRNYANRVNTDEVIELHSGLMNPPYNIYRGTLAALRIVDPERDTDPLFEGAIPLATAWAASDEGSLSLAIRHGLLPESASRSDIDAEADAFCICRVPDHSPEQARLAELIIGAGKTFALPAFAGEDIVEALPYRSVSWRFLFELIRFSPDRPLGGRQLMSRLLEPDLLAAFRPGAMRSCLFAWRWVAARTFFERGWTLLFDHAVAAVKSDREGLNPAELRVSLRDEYRAEHNDESLEEVMIEAAAHCSDPAWLDSRFSDERPRDFLGLIWSGIVAAGNDRTGIAPLLLEKLWVLPPIALADIHTLFIAARADGRSAADFWAELAEATLVQHVRSGLRKMGQGLPDSLLVDFNEGRWVVPSKALHLGSPVLAGARSRLDVALSWGEQLGWFVRDDLGVVGLTAFGEATADRWDLENGVS